MIGFWKVNEPYGEFSNWWLCDIVYEGHTFCSSEQVFMYMKAKLFGDEEVAQQILNTTNQKDIKALGRAVRGFSTEVWDRHKRQLMLEANQLKFDQHPELKSVLLSTGDEPICEASPMDRIWGIGLSVSNPNYENPSKWQGQNLLGKTLMELRAKYKLGEGGM